MLDTYPLVLSFYFHPFLCSPLDHRGWEGIKPYFPNFLSARDLDGILASANKIHACAIWNAEVERVSLSGDW